MDIFFKFLRYIPRSRITGSYSDSVFNILMKCQMFSIVAVLFYIHTSNVRGLYFLHILTVCYCLLDYSHPHACEVESHCHFDFIFQMTNNFEPLFMLAICIFCLKEYLFKSFAYFRKLDFLFIITL